MFFLEVPVLEKIVRSAVVYLFLVVVFRLLGRRQFGQWTPFDLIVLLIISNVLQNAMIGRDDSITGGLIGAGTIVGLNWVVAEAAFRSRQTERLIEGAPVVLIHHGRVVERHLAMERISHDELHAALRRQGIDHMTQVRSAILEANGALSVMKEEHSLKKA